MRGRVAQAVAVLSLFFFTTFAQASQKNYDGYLLKVGDSRAAGILASSLASHGVLVRSRIDALHVLVLDKYPEALTKSESKLIKYIEPNFVIRAIDIRSGEGAFESEIGG